MLQQDQTSDRGLASDDEAATRSRLEQEGDNPALQGIGQEKNVLKQKDKKETSQQDDTVKEK